MTAPYAPDLPAQAQPSAAQQSAAQQSAAELLVEPWLAAWPAALAAWGPTTRLAAPVFHTTPPTPAIGSFAWFDGGRVQVHIDLTWIVRDGLEDHAVAILAHEIGHHVMAPADARTRVIVAHRVRLGLIDQSVGEPSDPPRQGPGVPARFASDSFQHGEHTLGWNVDVEFTNITQHRAASPLGVAG